MKNNKIKIVKRIQQLLMITCFSTASAMATDYHFSEYYNASLENKTLRAAWYDQTFPDCATDSPSWIGWGGKQIRLTLKKTGIEDGFGQRTIYTNNGFGTSLVSTATMPLVVGQSYELAIDYYGQNVSGSSCSGVNQVRNVSTKNFIFDKHDTVLTFPIDLNVHSRKLHHQQTNKCFKPQMFGATAYDTLIVAGNCTGSSHLAFEIMDAGTGIDGEVKLKSQRLKQCLSPRLYTSADGAAVRAGSCLDNERTVFVMDKVKNPNTGSVIPGHFRLRHKDSGTCLYNYDYDNTAHLWSCWDSSNMIFTLDTY